MSCLFHWLLQPQRREAAQGAPLLCYVLCKEYHLVTLMEGNCRVMTNSSLLFTFDQTLSGAISMKSN